MLHNCWPAIGPVAFAGRQAGGKKPGQRGGRKEGWWKEGKPKELRQEEGKAVTKSGCFADRPDRQTKQLGLAYRPDRQT